MVLDDHFRMTLQHLVDIFRIILATKGEKYAAPLKRKGDMLDLRFGCPVVYQRLDFIGGEQQLIDPDPPLIAGVAALLATDRMP